MTNSRKEYFKQYYQNNKDKYKKSTQSTKTKTKYNNKLIIEYKKVIISFD